MNYNLFTHGQCTIVCLQDTRRIVTYYLCIRVFTLIYGIGNILRNKTHGNLSNFLRSFNFKKRRLINKHLDVNRSRHYVRMCMMHWLSESLHKLKNHSITRTFYQHHRMQCFYLQFLDPPILFYCKFFKRFIAYDNYMYQIFKKYRLYHVEGF